MVNISFAENFQGVADVFLRRPELYEPLLRFVENVMVGPSELSKIEREMIASHVSYVNGCGFCLGAHKATLDVMGAREDVVNAAISDPEAENIDPKFRPALSYAARLTVSPDAIRRADVENLLDAGWSENAVEDITNVVALFNYVNRLVDAFGIKGEDAYFAHVGRAIATQGYLPLIQSMKNSSSKGIDA